MHFNRNLILTKKEFIPHSRRNIERARGEIMNTQSFALQISILFRAIAIIRSRYTGYGTLAKSVVRYVREKLITSNYNVRAVSNSLPRPAIRLRCVTLMLIESMTMRACVRTQRARE